MQDRPGGKGTLCRVWAPPSSRSVEARGQHSGRSAWA